MTGGLFWLQPLNTAEHTHDFVRFVKVFFSVFPRSGLSVNSINCTGGETSLSDCDYGSPGRCSVHREQANLLCRKEDTKAGIIMSEIFA